MKRSILTLLALCTAFAAWGQPVFRESGKSVSELCTVENLDLVTAEADINKDGIRDLVIAIPDLYNDLNFAFYFGQADGSYKQFRDYGISVPDGLGITVTDKGVVRLQCDRDGGFDVFLFRWQDGDFRLIGGKKDRHKGEHFDESYNYLTGKMIRTEGEGKGRKVINSDLPALPAINFGWIPLNYNMLDYLHVEPEDGPMDADYILVMGIFRRMQDEEMLFWHFCEWDNPYHDPVPDGENKWYAEDAHESPGSYNAYSVLSFTKQNEGVFLIELSETFYDRSWEADINEDGSNIDELLEEAAPEESGSEEEWTFYNGWFTVG